MSFSIENQSKELQASHAAAKVAATIVGQEKELDLTPAMVTKLADVIAILAQDYPKLLDPVVVNEFTGAFFYTDSPAPSADPAYAALSTAVTCLTLGYCA